MLLATAGPAFRKDFAPGRISGDTRIRKKSALIWNRSLSNMSLVTLGNGMITGVNRPICHGSIKR
jgi:hypothetical protein